MDWGALYPEASAARTRDQLAQPKTYAPADQGAFSNFGSGVGNYFMRGMAETARNVSMAGAVVPIIADKLIGSDNQGTSLTDRYFQAHDEVFQNAVDYWTPKAGTVGKAGEITGQLAAGLVKFIASPALAVADAQLSTSTELTRAGVDTGAALIAGDLAGLSTVAGVAAPFVGRTLAAKMASGVAGNIVPNTLQSAATAGVLTAAGAPEQANGFDWADPTARALDVLMGAAFGGAAHYMTKMGERKFTLTDDQKNALLVANQARHLERAADLTATTAESTAHVAAMRQSVDQLLRGEPVTTAEPIPPHIAAETAEIQDELVKNAPEQMAPLARPDMAEGIAPPQKVAGEEPVRPPVPDVQVPTGEVHPDGSDVYIPARDLIAKAEAEAEASKTTGVDLYRAAANCLLGAL